MKASDKLLKKASEMLRTQNMGHYTEVFFLMASLFLCSRISPLSLFKYDRILSLQHLSCIPFAPLLHVVKYQQQPAEDEGFTW